MNAKTYAVRDLDSGKTYKINLLPASARHLKKTGIMGGKHVEIRL